MGVAVSGWHLASTVSRLGQLGVVSGTALAVVLARRIEHQVEELRRTLLPATMHVTWTRDYGETAQEKSNELVQHLLIATLSVVVLISLAMGWRSGLVVTVAVPVTLALTLFIYFLAGYTLNRVTVWMGSVNWSL